MAFPELQFCPGCTWITSKHNPGCPNAFRSVAAAFEKAQAGVEAAQRKEHPAQTAAAGGPIGILGPLTGERIDPDVYKPGPIKTVPCNTPRVVAMVVHKGRLYVATEKSVYFLNEDHELEELVGADPLRRPQDARAADEAAGLVPLHPNQKSGRDDPFRRGGR